MVDKPVAAGVKALPPALHVALVATVTFAVKGIVVLLAQTSVGAVIEMVGDGVNVIFTLSTWGTQTERLVFLILTNKLPALTSAAVGV